MLISVFGTELAENPGQVAASVPLPTELNNTEVRLGDKPLRLLFSSNAQVNAQIPFDLNPNTEHQIVVKRGDTISSPENFTVSTAQPAIFATAQNGVGQGAITNALTGVLADRAYPVRAGDFISIYCTGLGFGITCGRSGRRRAGNGAKPDGPAGYCHNRRPGCRGSFLGAGAWLCWTVPGECSHSVRSYGG